MADRSVEGARRIEQRRADAINAYWAERGFVANATVAPLKDFRGQYISGYYQIVSDTVNGRPVHRSNNEAGTTNIIPS